MIPKVLGCCTVTNRTVSQVPLGESQRAERKLIPKTFFQPPSCQQKEIQLKSVFLKYLSGVGVKSWESRECLEPAVCEVGGGMSAAGTARVVPERCARGLGAPAQPVCHPGPALYSSPPCAWSTHPTFPRVTTARVSCPPLLSGVGSSGSTHGEAAGAEEFPFFFVLQKYR